MNRQYRFRLVVYQDVPGLWVGRGLDHDIRAEGRTIGETVRALLRMIQAHGAFDTCDERDPLSALPAAPQSCVRLKRSDHARSARRRGSALL